MSEKAGNYLNVGIAWAIGLVAMYLAYSPPPLIAQFYSAVIGLLTASLFVPVIAGLWWKKANLAGGIASVVTGASVYLIVQFTPGTPPLSAILFALPASVLAMIIGGKLGQLAKPEMVENIERLHR